METVAKLDFSPNPAKEYTNISQAQRSGISVDKSGGGRGWPTVNIKRARRQAGHEVYESEGCGRCQSLIKSIQIQERIGEDP